MKTEYRIFGIITLFFFVVSALYWWWTKLALHEADYIGTVALLLTGLLTLMIGGYFWFVSRRVQPRPEDRDDAEIEEGAGEIGFFSPGSYWPFGLGMAVFVAGLGLAYWRWWLIALGLIAVLMATGGLLFEYYTGARRGAQH
jgi:hypothetical protein